MHCAIVDRGDQVIGMDNLNDYYDVGLKEARLDQLTPHDNFKFIKCGIEQRDAVAAVFRDTKPDRDSFGGTSRGALFIEQSACLY